MTDNTLKTNNTQQVELNSSINKRGRGDAPGGSKELEGAGI